MTTFSSKTNERFYELDIMRFLAALVVLMYHYTFSFPRLFSFPPYSIDRVFRYGYLGVDCFFMISGYVVLMSSLNKSPKIFFISRVVRLYPAYWVTCIFTFIILYFGKVSLSNIPQVSFKLLAYNLTMLQEFFGKPSINGVFWTLTFEISFYFIILIIAALKLWKNLLLVLFCWLVYSFIAGAHSTNNAFSFLLIPKYSCCFISGMLFYLLRIKFNTSWKIYSLLILCYLLNVKNDLIIRYDMNIFYHDAKAYNGIIVAVIITLFYIIFLISALNKINFSRLRKLALLGELTYPLYLIHGFGIGAFMYFSGRVNKYALLIVVTFFMVLLSWCIYKFVEKETRIIFRNILTKALAYLS